VSGPTANKTLADKSSGKAPELSPARMRRPLRTDVPTHMLALQRSAGNQAVGDLMGTDFALPETEPPDVRIHSGPEAESRTEAQHAAAYTTGRDVYLGCDVDLATDLGQRVLRHEFTHVLQQERGRMGMPFGLQAGLEAEAQAASGVGTAGTFSVGPAASPGSAQSITEAELQEEWRRLHPGQGLPMLPAGPGEIPKVDEEADRVQREAYKVWREERLKQAGAEAAAKVRPWNEADEARRRAAAAEPQAETGFTDSEGRLSQGPVTLLPSEVFMPIVPSAQAAQAAAAPPRKRNLAEEAKKAWEARTSPREKAEAAKRPPPKTFVGEHERRLLEAASMFDIVPGAKLGRLIAEFVEGEDIIGRKLDRRELSREISKETLLQVGPLLLPEEGLLGGAGEGGGIERETLMDLPPAEPIEEVLEPTATPVAEHPEGFFEGGVEVPEAPAELPLEPTAHPPAGDVDVRGIYGKQPGRATPGQHTVPEGMGTETPHSKGSIEVPEADPEAAFQSHREPRARTPRSKEVTRAQQLEGIPEKSAATSAREEFDAVRDAYAESLHVPPGGDVHHAIELNVLDEYPGVFEADELNSLENMRGIAPEFNDELHLSKIRTEWNRHYRNLDRIVQEEGLVEGTPAYNDRVRKYLTDARDEIDYLLKPFFTETRTPYFPAP
jgi:hypothetical protein